MKNEILTTKEFAERFPDLFDAAHSTEDSLFVERGDGTKFMLRPNVAWYDFHVLIPNMGWALLEMSSLDHNDEKDAVLIDLYEEVCDTYEAMER